MTHNRSLAFLLVSGLVGGLAACSSGSDRPATGAAGTTGGVAGNGAAGASAGSGGGTGGDAVGAAGSGDVAGTSGGAGSGSAGSAGSSGVVDAAAGMSGADAGAPDATTDAGGAGGGAGGACPFTFCDDFEGAAVGTATSPWALDVDKKGTVVETVSDKGHSGTHAVHVKMSAMAGVFGYITETKTLAETGASFWGRVYIWYAVDLANVHIVNVAIDGKSGTVDEQVRIVNVIGDHVATNRRSDDMGKGSNVTPPQGSWVCYEWHITPNNLDVYYNGTLLPISETWTEPTISLFRTGFERFAMGAAGEIWLDDFVINKDGRVGCQ
jgi:hypothetical protein